MKPWQSCVSFLPFVVGSLAKGQGGRRGSSFIDDNWHVPGTIKATMAFQIIFFILILGEFITIVRQLRFVPPGRYTRALRISPLAVVAGTLEASCLV